MKIKTGTNKQTHTKLYEKNKGIPYTTIEKKLGWKGLRVVAVSRSLNWYLE